MTFKSLKLSLFLCGLMLLPATAHADKDNGKGHGKNHSEKSFKSHGDEKYSSSRTGAVVIVGDDRDIIRQYLRSEYRSNCPPGLAKKNNGCLPPGQAKKRYSIGGILPDDVVWVPVSLELRRHLSPLPRGYQYVQVDKDVLLIAEASKKVIDAVTLLSAVGD